MKKLRENYITIIIFAMAIVINIGAFASYFTNIKSNLAEQTDSHIDDIMDEAEECINLKLEEQINTVDTLALFVSTLMEQNSPKDILDNALKEQKKKSGYDVLEVVSLDGIGSNTNENYAELKYFKKALDGTTVMQEEAGEAGVDAVAFAAPIYDIEGENVIGVLVAKMDVETFTDTIEISSFNQNGKAFVVKKDGTLLSKSKMLSSATSINDIFPEKKYEEELISSMRSRNSGVITYNSEDTTRYIGYSKLSFNKWYVVCIISSSVVEANAGDVETDLLILGVEIAVILVVLVVYLVYNIVSVKKKGQINLERYFIATKYADTIMFDYSVAKDTMYSNEKWEQVFGYKLPKDDVKQKVNDIIYEEDLELYNEKIEQLSSSKEDIVFSIRINDKKKNIKKCVVKLFPICEKKDKITKVIGTIEEE